MEDDALNDRVEVIAREQRNGDIMGIKIKDRPFYGVQFHPESVGTEDGLKIISNFIEISKKRHARTVQQEEKQFAKQLSYTEIFTKLDSEQIFTRLYQGLQYAFWLDSSQLGLNGNYSVLGTSDHIIECNKAGNFIVQKDPSGAFVSTPAPGSDPFALVAETLDKSVASPGDFPFSFVGGLVGFFSYEAKRWTSYGESNFPGKDRFSDVILMKAEAFLLIAHATGRTFACSTASTPEQHRDYAATIRAELLWIDSPVEKYELRRTREGEYGAPGRQLDVRMKFGREEYKLRIERVFEELRNGESYEVCLTNGFEAQVEADPYTLYRVLRLVNPAPFSAYLKFGDGAVFSSSPERFISGSQLSIMTDPQGICFRSDLRWGVSGRGKEIDAERTLDVLVQTAIGFAEAGGNAFITIGRVNHEVQAVKEAYNRFYPHMDVYSFSTNSETANAYIQETKYDPRLALTGQKIMVGNKHEMILRALIDVAEGTQLSSRSRLRAFTW